jgi:hypothetical protein
MSIRHQFSKRVVAAASIPTAVVASGAMVWHASYSAFSSTTTNPTSNWAAGTVALVDDDSNTALFNASNLKPGSNGNKCIAVTSNGSLPGPVKLYASGAATGTKSLSDFINITVDEGTGGTFAGGCSGFSGTQVYTGTLTAFGTTKTSYATGVGSWTTSGTAGDTKVYRITYTVSSSTPDTAQGGTAALGFTWEAQNS